MKKTIYYNGTIITMNDTQKQAEAVYVEDGKIVKVGKLSDIECFKGNDTTMFDLKGNTMIPGFIDPHGHITAIAQTFLLVDLSEATSVEDVKASIRKFMQERELAPDEWILGFGYDNTKFPDQQHPTKFDLDEVTTEHPIYLTHVSGGHLSTTNSKALEKFGYCGDSYEVPEGGIVRVVEGTNEPNGVLEENACLAPEKRKVIPAPSLNSLIGCLERAQKLYASLGITTCEDASIDYGMHALLTQAANSNSLFIDIVGLVVADLAMKYLKNEGKPQREYNNHYKLLGGKIWLDGSPQGKTAWLTQPYYEVPEGQDKDYCGYGVHDDKTITEFFKTMIENNIQSNAHCNGDAAADQYIRCYRKALEESGNKADLRPVMIHAQTVREDQLDEMKELGILPTFFLDHIWFWGDYHYESVLGPERANRISLAKAALDRGINFTLHQDPPVKLPNQVLAIHNAVNRETQSGRVLGEDQRLTVEEALKAVTINGAYQYFEEDTKGSIEEGKVADFVILDKNPLEIPVKELKTMVVLKTIKEDNVIFEK